MTASLISSNASYLILAFLPPIFWLLFYLREDCHPEPKLLLFLTFIGGMASALLALVAECVWVFGMTGSCIGASASSINPAFLFLGIAFIEECAKYLPVRFLVISRCKNHNVCEFDEPIDAMIYMLTSALGFAALENALFSFGFFYKATEGAIVPLPFTVEGFLSSFSLAANRFIGANLLHALSSAIVGFFLARMWFSPHRHHFLLLGLIIASLLHAAFNYLILIKELIPQGTFYIILLLATMGVMVLIDFERLKGKEKEEKQVT